MDLHALSLKNKGIDIIADITNPNLFPLKIKDGALSFKIQDIMEMEGSMEKVISIPPKSTQEVSMHSVVTDGSMIKSGWKMLTNKKGTRFNYEFIGKVESENKLLSDSKMVMKVNGTLDEILNVVKKIK